MLKTLAINCFMMLMSLVLCIGYATLSDKMMLSGDIGVDSRKIYDVYITEITPTTSAGITVNSTSGTVMFASVDGPGTAVFTIDVINISATTYVFDRVIDGAEASFEGAYSGTEITYELSGIKRLDEIASYGGTLTFDITINVPEGITAEYYILNYNFIAKFGIPSEDYFPEDMPDDEKSLIQRLSDILNNKYKTLIVSDSRRYLLEETIKVTSWGTWPYVGSMDPTYEEQLDNLFGDVTLDTSVSFILKHEDLNDDGYSEVALYSTSDPLDCTDKDPGNGVVCVYVTVFTPAVNEYGTVIGYNMLCESVRGYCGEVRYSQDELIPSFSTDTWLNDIGFWNWTEELGSFVDKVPDDAWSNDWTVPFRQQFESYNMYYMYSFWRTAPYGDPIEVCLEGKIPTLP